MNRSVSLSVMDRGHGERLVRRGKQLTANLDKSMSNEVYTVTSNMIMVSYHTVSIIHVHSAVYTGIHQ